MNHSDLPIGRVLVAGGAGFLGAHLCRRLLDQGHEVICLDSFVTGRMARLDAVCDHPRLTVLHGDVTDAVPDSIRPTHIFNLACPASPVHYQADPLYTFRTSVYGTDNLLACAARHGARYVQASTSEVYGDPLVHPQTEDYRGNVNPLGVRACYDEGKRGAESLCADWRRVHGVDVRIARIFNTYGPHMNVDDGRLVSNLICQALRGEPMTVFGDGSQTRSLCYVDDLVEALLRLMACPSCVEPVNLGNPQERTVVEIAQEIQRLCRTHGGHVFKPLPGDDPMRRRPDITRAHRVLKWLPRVDLETGLARTIDYFRRELADAEAVKMAL